MVLMIGTSEIVIIVLVVLLFFWQVKKFLN